MPRSKKQIRLTLLSLLLAGCGMLSACVPLVIGTATITAIDLVQDRRTMGRNIDDNALELKLRTDFRSDSMLGKSAHLSVTVINGLVLLTGEIQQEPQRERAVGLANYYSETRKVVDEIELTNATDLRSRTNDSWITSKVKTKLLRAPGIPSSNIKVVTEKGRVYLLGLVTRAEAERSVSIAKTVRGVSHIYKVFEYIEP
ncbi:MAG: BON domain-containing protein [Gammaproteobacteria bacterium]|nr:BON domain-containing protein [Gammaproteobacteria bacterium]